MLKNTKLLDCFEKIVKKYAKVECPVWLTTETDTQYLNRFIFLNLVQLRAYWVFGKKSSTLSRLPSKTFPEFVLRVLLHEISHLLEEERMGKNNYKISYAASVSIYGHDSSTFELKADRFANKEVKTIENKKRLFRLINKEYKRISKQSYI